MTRNIWAAALAALALAVPAGAQDETDHTHKHDDAAAAEKKAEPAAPAEEARMEAAPPAAAMKSALKVSKLAVCTDVEERAPVGEAEAFPSDVGKLWCFTRIEGATSEPHVYHRWYVGDRMVSEVAVRVGGPSWRCWSWKTIQPGWSGPCRVEIATEEGDVLATESFTLGGAARPAAEPATESSEG